MEEVPRHTSLAPLVSPCLVLCCIGGNRRALRLPGEAGIVCIVQRSSKVTFAQSYSGSTQGKVQGQQLSRVTSEFVRDGRDKASTMKAPPMCTL